MVIAQAQDLSWTTWDEADGGNGHQYVVLTEPATWMEQLAAAEAEGGYLATVLSQEEQDFVMGLISAAEADPGPGDYYWFGLIQEEGATEPDGGWYWLSGEIIDETSYTNWAAIEPNNQGGEYLGAIHKGWGTWNDTGGAADLRAIIEREAPEPDTTPPDTSLDEPDPSVLPWGDGVSPVIVGGTVTDDVSGVASATVTVEDEYSELDGAHDVTGLLDDSGYFELNLDLSSEVRSDDADGRQYLIFLSAEDNAGNSALPISTKVLARADTAPPDTSLDEPDPSVLPPEPESTPVTVAGSVTDAESGVASATVAVIDEYAELSADYDVTESLDENGSFALTVELSSAVEPDDADGRTYEIVLTASDIAGNEADPVVALVTAPLPEDTTPPTVSLNSPEPSELPRRPIFRRKPVRISGTVVDDQSGVASATVSVEDEYDRCEPTRDVTGALDAEGNFETIVRLWAWVRGWDRDGREYEIKLTAVDNAGNVAEPDVVFVRSPHPWERWRNRWRR